MIPSNVRIFLCNRPVDMRRSFDGLAQAARECLGKDPTDGGLFVFHGKDLRRLKVFWVDSHSCCVLAKRLHGARFVLPRRDGVPPELLTAQELALLLQGVVRARNQSRLH
jgi:transposase